MKVEGSNCWLVQDLSNPLALFVIKFPCAQTIKPKGEKNLYFKLCMPAGEKVSSFSTYISDESHRSIGCPHLDSEWVSLGGQMCVCVPKWSLTQVNEPRRAASHCRVPFQPLALLLSPTVDFVWVWVSYIRCRLTLENLGCHIFDPLESLLGCTLETRASGAASCSLPPPTLVSHLSHLCHKPSPNTFTCWHQPLRVQSQRLASLWSNCHLSYKADFFMLGEGTVWVSHQQTGKRSWEEKSRSAV